MSNHLDMNWRRWPGKWGRLVLNAALLAAAWAQAPLSLEQAGARAGADFVPAREGQAALLEGVVSSPAIRLGEYALLPIQDTAGFGIALDGRLDLLAGFAPGDRVAARGVIGRRFGMAVLQVSGVTRTAPGAAPAPRRFRVKELQTLRHIGTLVTTDAEVTLVAENAGGDMLQIGDDADPLRVFLPRVPRQAGNSFAMIRPGDRVRVTGVMSQYCPLPPFNRQFQLLVREPQAVVLIDRGWIVSPQLLSTALALSLIGLMVWWVRERRMADQRQMMRTLNSLGEEVLGSASPVEVVERLVTVLPGVLKIQGVRMYLHNKAAKTLDRVETAAEPESRSVKIDAPQDSLSSAVAICFRNRTLLAFSDAKRSELFKAGGQTDAPRALMLIPMFAQNDLLGVLELDHEQESRQFSADEQAATQHLANQIATSLKLLEQRSIQEQLFRSEKLAAAGQLISGVANELRAPLQSISIFVNGLIARRGEAEAYRELQGIAAEAGRASEIVARLVALAHSDRVEVEQVDLRTLLTNLANFREPEWKQRGVQLRNLFDDTPLYVLGSRGQLEQVFLNLLVHAEQSLAAAKEKKLSLAATIMNRRVQLEISYSSPTAEEHDPFEEGRATEAGALGLGVCRGIIQGHGGEIRLLRAGADGARFEVELPLSQAVAAEDTVRTPVRAAGRTMTTLLVEPEAAVQRQLLGLLSARGHRVVPISSAEEAEDLVGRLRFELVLCSVRLPGSNWVELFERVHLQIGAFVLLTEGYDGDLARAFQGREGHVLRKPVQESELEVLLGRIEPRLEQPPVPKP